MENIESNNDVQQDRKVLVLCECGEMIPKGFLNVHFKGVRHLNKMKVLFPDKLTEDMKEKIEFLRNRNINSSKQYYHSHKVLKKKTQA